MLNCIMLAAVLSQAHIADVNTVPYSAPPIVSFSNLNNQIEIDASALLMDIRSDLTRQMRSLVQSTHKVAREGLLQENDFALLAVEPMLRESIQKD